jgi:hypothetical protein
MQMQVSATALHVNINIDTIDPGGEVGMSAPPKAIPTMKNPSRRRRDANHVPGVVQGILKSQSACTMTIHLRRS